MKKLSSIILLLFLPLFCFAQSESNLLEYTLQVKETDSGTAIIVAGRDFISSDYYKTRIQITERETVEEAVNRLNKQNFKVKATTTVNGKQVVTMAIKIDPRMMEDAFNELLRIGEELDRMFLNSIEIDYGD